MRAWLRTHSWHWFALALVLFLVSVVIHGGAQPIVGSASAFVFLAACIRYAGLAVRDGRDMVLTRSLLGGLPTLMAGEMRRRKRRRDS